MSWMAHHYTLQSDLNGGGGGYGSGIEYLSNMHEALSLILTPQKQD